MSYQPFLIANARVGLERDMEPWLLPNDAFPDLEDCYMWRGRVKKRLGFDLLGRLCREIFPIAGTSLAPITTDAFGNFVGPVFAAPNLPVLPYLSHFEIGTQFFQDDGSISPPGNLLTNGPGTGALDRATGILTITGAAPNTPISFCPGLPVMGLPTIETNSINEELLGAFDTVFSYRYSNAGATFIDTSFHKTTNTLVYWTGPDYQQFWTTNYLQALWATNYTKGFQDIPTTTVAGRGDGIRWYDQNLSGWVNFLPQINTPVPPALPNFLMGCLIILPFKGRLIVFNTIEGSAFGTSTNYYQRARWSQVGTPYYAATTPAGFTGGFQIDAWNSDIPGKGGFIDAPTGEQIVSAEFIKDTLIVYFERSTWNFRYTGNEILPFVWEKINTELGSESTFSVVPFDRSTIAVGNFGIHACDSVNVQRIDQKIPDEIFQIQNANNGPERTSGIRDYYNQLVYWAFPYIGAENPGIDGLVYPNKLLVYNYVDESFSFFNDSFTCFGYFQSANDLAWNQANQTWQEANFAWISALSQSQFANIVGGNQQGFVEILMQKTTNSDSLFISSMAIGSPLTTLVVPSHNLLPYDPTSSNVAAVQYIKITTASGTTGLTGNIYPVFSVIDSNTITIAATPTGAFTGDGLITPVNNMSIYTKRFNPFISGGNQVSLGYVDLYLDRTDFGQITVNLYINEDDSVPVNSSFNVVPTYPESTYSQGPDLTPFAQARLWKRIYFSNISELFQMQLTMSPQQMIDNNVISSDIVLHGMVLWFAKSGRLINV